MAETKTTVEDVVTPVTEEAAPAEVAADTSAADTKDTSKTAEKKTGGRKKAETAKLETAKEDEVPETTEVKTEDSAVADTSTAETAAETKQEDAAIESNADEIAAGAKIETAIRIRLYATQTAATPIQTIKGKFYTWDNTILNGRIRLTDSPSGIGTVGRVIGWVEAAAIANYIK